ncbi:MAG: hypothetical protein M3357_07085 [Actinomycetota bacterium]|nr:hypothetical protein [Actinomycetota bacterium]
MVIGARERIHLLVALLPLPLIAVAAAALGDRAEPRTPRAVPTTAPAGVPEPVLREEFLDAYERSRRATWLITYDFTRRLVNGGKLDLTVTYLNRPPDHLNIGLGGVSGRVGGRTVVCNEVEGRELCAPEGPVVPFEEELASEISELRDVLQPPQKWYVVEGGGVREVSGEDARCFGLRRVADVRSPPYGERAEYCFATGDGAPLLNRRERTQGIDQRVAVEITRQVGDAEVAALLAPE